MPRHCTPNLDNDRPVVLDISRLLSRAARDAPTGIDRVELEYAIGLQLRLGQRLHYAAVHPLGRFSLLPTSLARRFVTSLSNAWRLGPKGHGIRREAIRLALQLLALMMLPGLGLGLKRNFRQTGVPIYLLVSHHHLHQPDIVARAKRRIGGDMVCFIHDLIPIEYPEYNRPLEFNKHRIRLETAMEFSSALIVNSAATSDALRRFMPLESSRLPILVAPLGVPQLPPNTETSPPPGRPYFVCIGTIEPRKNHLFLLNIWRRLAAKMGPDTPRLVLIGQRGWENEMVLDMLERCEALRGHVIELNGLPDARVQALIAGAAALLMPSFAEGYGLPVAEALAAGTPVICSGLPALYEVGGDVPTYLDPLDGAGWMAAIRDYATANSPARAAQLDRLRWWQPPSWDTHLEAVLALLAELPASAFNHNFFSSRELAAHRALPMEPT